MTSINFLFNWLINNLLRKCIDRWDNVFENGPSEIYGGQPLKNLKWYGLLSGPYHLKFFKDCFPQVLFGPCLNICPIYPLKMISWKFDFCYLDVKFCVDFETLKWLCNSHWEDSLNIFFGANQVWNRSSNDLKG